MEKKSRRKSRKITANMRILGTGSVNRALFPRKEKVPLSVRQDRNTRQRLKFWKTYHDELHIEER